MFWVVSFGVEMVSGILLEGLGLLFMNLSCSCGGPFLSWIFFVLWADLFVSVFLASCFMFSPFCIGHLNCFCLNKRHDKGPPESIDPVFLTRCSFFWKQNPRR